MPLHIVHNNIVNMKTDAIVNAANKNLRKGAGVCGAIFSGAKDPQLEKDCKQLAPCETGKAVITNGYNLEAKYIIHAVGPVYKGGKKGEEELLYLAYHNSLRLAKAHQLESISFPLISAGIYGYPTDQALQVAKRAMEDFLLEEEMEIYLVVFDRKSVELGSQLLQKMNHYVDTYFEDTVFHSNLRSVSEEVTHFYDAPDLSKMARGPVPLKKKERKLEDLLEAMDETFSQMLFRLIDEKGYTDVQVYKRANMDRKLFSKIRSNEEYSPKKQTVIALAIGLKLSLDEAKDLLNKAGYSLSNSNKSDVIIRYFLENEEYDMFTINEMLFVFELPTL